MRHRHADERGNVSLLVMAVIVVAFVVCAAVARLGGAAAERARANAAADAAALAAADGLALGESSARACAGARRVAADNGARVLSCRSVAPGARPGSAEVVVAHGAARARARSEVDPTFGRASIAP